MTPDVNVLVAASRSDHTHHRQALSWLNEAITNCAAGNNISILPMVASGFLRLVTHPKIFVHPTPIGKAIAFIDTLLVLPGVEMPELGHEWKTFSRFCREGKLSANNIPDAWIAAAVRTNGDHLVTFDRDFIALLDRGELTLLQ